MPFRINTTFEEDRKRSPLRATSDVQSNPFAPQPQANDGLRQTDPLRPTGNNYTEDQLEVEQRSRTPFQQGLAQGSLTARSVAPALGAVARGLVGDEEGAVRSAERSMELTQRGAEVGPTATARGVLDGEDNVGDYLAGLAGSQALTLGSIFATGGVGGIAGRAAAGVATRTALRSAQARITDAAGRKAAAQTAVSGGARGAQRQLSRADDALGQAVTRGKLLQDSYNIARSTGQRRGAYAGSFGAISAVITPDGMPIILDDDDANEASVRQRAAAVGGAALVGGAINTLPVVHVLRRFGMAGAVERRARHGAARTFAQDTLGVGAFEMAAESATIATMRAAHRLVNENIDMFDEETLGQLFEGAVAGFIIGSAMGAAGGTAQVIRMRGETPGEADTKNRLSEARLKNLRAQKFKENLEGATFTPVNNRYMAPEEKFQRAESNALGRMTLMSDDGALPQNLSGDDYTRIGTAFRVLLDPSANVSEQEVQQAAELLSNEFEIDINDSQVVQTVRQNMVNLKAEHVLVLDEMIDLLVNGVEIEALQQRIAETSRADVVAVFEAERDHLIEARAALFNEAKNDGQLLQILTVDEATGQIDLVTDQVPDPDQAADPGQTELVPSEGQTAVNQFETGINVYDTPPQIIPAFAPDSRGVTAAQPTTSSQGWAAPVIGRILPAEGAANVASKLNEEVGTTQEFVAAPAGDAAIRVLRETYGLDDSETAARSPDVQAEVVSIAQKVQETALARKDAAKRLPENMRLQGDDYQSAVNFLNQFETVVTERHPSAVNSADPQALTAAQLRDPNRPIVVERGVAQRQDHIPAVDQNTGQSVDIDLVALTQAMVQRVDKAGRGGSREARARAGAQAESGAAGTLSDENVARALSVGLSELITRHGFLLAEAGGDPRLNTLLEVRQKIENDRAEGLDTSASEQLVETLTRKIAEDFRPIIEQNLADDKIAFRSHGQDRTVGETSRKGVAASKAALRKETNVAQLEQNLKELRAKLKAVPKGRQAAERRSQLQNAIQSVQGQLDTARAAQDLVTARLELLGSVDTKNQATLEKMFGSPTSTIKGLSLERHAIIATESKQMVPKIPIVPENKRNMVKDQMKMNAAGNLATKQKGSLKFIGEGSVRSSTNLYRRLFGSRANTGNYSSNDVVVISVEGRRGSSVGFSASVQAELQAAIDAGATVVTDVKAQREAGSKAKGLDRNEQAILKSIESALGVFSFQPTSANAIFRQSFKKAQGEMRTARLVRDTNLTGLRGAKQQAERYHREAVKELESLGLATKHADELQQISRTEDVYQRSIGKLQNELFAISRDSELSDTAKIEFGLEKLEAITELSEAANGLNKRREQVLRNAARAEGSSLEAIRRVPEVRKKLRDTLNALEQTTANWETQRKRLEVLHQRRKALLKRAAEIDPGFNTGEQAAAEYLAKQGYKESKLSNQASSWVPQRRRSPKVEAEPRRAATRGEAPPADTETDTTPAPSEQAQRDAYTQKFKLDDEVKAVRKETLKDQAEKGAGFWVQDAYENLMRHVEKLSDKTPNATENVSNTISQIHQIVADTTELFGIPEPEINIVSFRPPGETWNALYQSQFNVVHLHTDLVANKQGRITPKVINTLIHELAHAAEFAHLENMSSEHSAALSRDYSAWKKYAEAQLAKTKDLQERGRMIDRLTMERRGQSPTTFGLVKRSKEKSDWTKAEVRRREEYLLDPREWFADTAARMVVEGSTFDGSGLNKLSIQALKQFIKKMIGHFTSLRNSQMFKNKLDSKAVENYLLDHQNREAPLLKGEAMSDDGTPTNQPKLTKAQKARLKVIDAEIKRARELQRLVEKHRQLAKNPNAINSLLKVNQVIDQLLYQKRLEDGASQMTETERASLLLQELARDERSPVLVDDVMGENVVDHLVVDPEGKQETVPDYGQAPPWVTAEQATKGEYDIPTQKQRGAESRTVTGRLLNIGVDQPVRVISWAEAEITMSDQLTPRASLEALGSLSTMVDGELLVWVNETARGSRDAMIMRETARHMAIEALSAMKVPQLKKIFGPRIAKKRVLAALNNRTEHFGVLKENQIGDSLDTFEVFGKLAEELGTNPELATFRGQLEGLVGEGRNPADLIVNAHSVTENAPVTKFAEVVRARRDALRLDTKTQNKLKKVLENEEFLTAQSVPPRGSRPHRPKVKKVRPKRQTQKEPSPVEAAKQAAETRAGEKRHPNVESPPPGAQDAFDSFVFLGSPFSVDGMYAARSMIINRLTAAERQVLGKALNKVPVRAQVVNFLNEQGLNSEAFLEDPYSFLALSMKMHEAGMLNLDSSASDVFNSFSKFAHRVMGVIKNSDQADAIFDAFSNNIIQSRKTVFDVDVDSNLGRDLYALDGPSMEILHDTLKLSHLDSAKKLKDLGADALVDQLANLGRMEGMNKTKLKLVAEDLVNGAITRDKLKKWHGLSEYVTNPEAQFALQRFAETRMGKLSEAIHEALQWARPVFERIMGESMMARFTGNPVLLDLASSFATDITSTSRGEAMFSRKTRRMAKYHGAFLRTTEFMTDSEKVELRKILLDPNYKSDNATAVTARKEIAKQTNEVYRYGKEAGIEMGKLDPQTYWPRVFEAELVQKNAEALVSDWMRSKYAKNWEALARERGDLKVGAKMSETDRQSFIERILHGIINENGGLADSVDTGDVGVDTNPRVGAMNTRDLAFLTDAESTEVLSKVVSQDINRTMTVYIDQMVKRAEYVRTFGKNGEKFMAQIKRARQFGATDADVRLMYNMANSALGRHGLEVNAFWKFVMKPIEAMFYQPVKGFKSHAAAAQHRRDKGIKGKVMPDPDVKDSFMIDRRPTSDPRRFRLGMSAIVVYQNVRVLGMAVMTNVADNAGLPMRTGSFAMAGAGYKAGLTEVVNSIKNSKLPHKEKKAQMSSLRNLAQDLGIVEFSVVSDILGQLYGGNMLSGRAKKINDGFFKLNGMEWLTRTTRLMATATSQRFLVDHARQAIGGDAKSRALLAEIDLRPEDVFIENGELKFLTSDEISTLLEPIGVTVPTAVEMAMSDQQFAMLTDTKMIDRQKRLRRVAADDRLRRAMFRMVDESVLRPNPTQRPSWMNNPNWMLFSHLKGFMYTYHERVFRRAYHKAAQGNFLPAMMLSNYVALIMAMDLMREIIQHGSDDNKEDWTFRDRLQDGFRRSGVTGTLTFAMDMKASQRYGSSALAEAAGPTVSQGNRLYRAFVQGRANKSQAVYRSLPLSQWGDVVQNGVGAALSPVVGENSGLEAIVQNPLVSNDIRSEARKMLGRE